MFGLYFIIISILQKNLKNLEHNIGKPWEENL